MYLFLPFTCVIKGLFAYYIMLHGWVDAQAFSYMDVDCAQLCSLQQADFFG